MGAARAERDHHRARTETEQSGRQHRGVTVHTGQQYRLVPVGDVEGLAAAITNAWKDREPLGRAASDTVRTRYNTRVLDSQLAESLRTARGSA